jgi:hypothetical protein
VFYRPHETVDRHAGPTAAGTHALILSGKVGSEKISFLQHDKVKEILAKKYNITLAVKKAGSVEMVSEPSDGLDFLWPASRVNLEYFKEAGNHVENASDIFNSPIVIYSWDIVADALISRQIVQVQNKKTCYITDFPKLLQMITDKQTWKDIGLPQLYGKIAIKSTDPTKSNSGNMFAALLANTLNGGDVATSDTIEKLIPGLQDIFGRLGFMEESSGILFDMYIKQGVGAYPMIVGYENQIVEFSREHPKAVDMLRDKIRVLYPMPTVWASHPFIALNANGTRLLQALADKDIQELAWENHGFRSGITGIENDLSIVVIPGFPQTIESVVSTPNSVVMGRITQALKPQ